MRAPREMEVRRRKRAGERLLEQVDTVAAAGTAARGRRQVRNQSPDSHRARQRAVAGVRRVHLATNAMQARPPISIWS